MTAITETTMTTQTATNKELSAGLAEITGTTETTKTTGCKPRVPQTTGLEIPEMFERFHVFPREFRFILEWKLTVCKLGAL